MTEKSRASSREVYAYIEAHGTWTGMKWASLPLPRAQDLPAWPCTFYRESCLTPQLTVVSLWHSWELNHSESFLQMNSLTKWKNLHLNQANWGLGPQLVLLLGGDWAMKVLISLMGNLLNWVLVRGDWWGEVAGSASLNSISFSFLSLSTSWLPWDTQPLPWQSSLPWAQCNRASHEPKPLKPQANISLSLNWN